jgi:hypothetical protein
LIRVDVRDTAMSTWWGKTEPYSLLPTSTPTLHKPTRILSGRDGKTQLLALLLCDLKEEESRRRKEKQRERECVLDSSGESL